MRANEQQRVSHASGAGIEGVPGARQGEAPRLKHGL